MRVLFYTTETNECRNHVRAWNSIAAIPAVHLTYDYLGIRNDWRLVEAARSGQFDVIFYVGVFRAQGNPRPDAFRAARAFAPLINLCSDAADAPWHSVLREYAKRGCFDLQVAIDGATEAPVDLSVLTPIDPGTFRTNWPRIIRCGFSGSVGSVRRRIVNALKGSVIVRHRAEVDGYDAHAAFLGRCRLAINLSATGSGERHHIKGRVLEAGWAGCALLEPVGSPFLSWFPSDARIAYANLYEARQLINTLDDGRIERAARRLSEVLNAKYRPEMIYGEILENVGLTLKKSAA